VAGSAYGAFMARQLRPNIAGGIYHITIRGVRRHLVYEDRIDYTRFLNLLREVSRDLAWISHIYCEMPNHYHLVLETPEPNLSVGMQRLNSRYAQWFNWRHGYQGHVFECRFYSGLIEGNAPFPRSSPYVLLNPVRAGLCRHPREWPFSSYDQPLTPRLMDQFGGDPELARRRFEAFVDAGVRSGRVSGSDPKTRLDQPKPYVPAKRWARRRTRSAAGRPTTFR
jgi:putative transposase